MDSQVSDLLRTKHMFYSYLPVQKSALKTLHTKVPIFFLRIGTYKTFKILFYYKNRLL